MHRRISAVFELAAPSHLQRRLIWRRITSSDAISLDARVDLDAISLRYEMTGGYIRNAVLAALLRAVGRSPHAPVVTQDDLHEGCREQMRGTLQLGGEMLAQPLPSRSVESLLLPADAKAALAVERSKLQVGALPVARVTKHRGEEPEVLALLTLPV